MPERCSSFSAQPPAPTKTNFARISPGVRPIGAAVLHAPRAVGQALEAAHLGVGAHVGAVLGETVEELVGQRAEVDVGARGHPRRRERLALAALLHQQRRPLVDDARVLAVLDAGEQRLVLQRLVALLEVRDILLAAHEGHVRGGVDERRRRVEHAGLDERRPELAALLELLVDRDRLGGIDACRPCPRACSSARRAPRGRCRRCSRRSSSPARRRCSRSKTAIFRSGCSCCRSVPRVALMMPPPISRTSTVPVGRSLSSGLGQGVESGVSVTRRF